MADVKAIEALVEPVVRRLGFALVRVQMQGGARNPTLQIMAEDAATRQLTLDQCATISRAVSDLLDEADPIESEYRLEVSSPGIDRPLTRAQDWMDWAGFDAKVETAEPFDGRKRFQGPIVGVEGDAALLQVEGLGRVALPLDGIRTAKLLLTDALIKATTPLDREGADEVLGDDENQEDD